YLTFRWHTHKNSSYGMRYLYVIALILGLGVSIHVVMLTILPALIYFYTISTRICSFSKKIKTLVFSFVILCIIWIFSTHIFFYVAAYFDLFFVNYLTLPLNSGLLFFASLLILLFLIILTYTYTKKHVRVHHFFVIAALFCIGYSMFGVILIRANAHTPYNVGMQSHAFALTSHHSKYSNS